MFEEYPQEYFVKIDDDFIEGRLTLNLLDDGRFSVELDLVQRESRKIWKHIGLLGPFSPQVTKHEAIDLAYQEFSSFLRKTTSLY